FRVKPMITSTPLKVRKYRYIAVEPGTRHTVSLDAVIKCNFHDPVVTWYVKRGAKTIFWTGGKKQECGGKARGFPVGGAWYNTQVPAGTKVTITMVVKGTTGAGKGASYTTAPVAWKAT
ncbi:MAG: hypothetical protein JWN72_1107, partial [Thermoleophilia bacterium]|nr:hypothetical protein [Thermoleophilia bacterium]